MQGDSTNNNQYAGLVTNGGGDANGLITSGLSINQTGEFSSNGLYDDDYLYLENGDIYVEVAPEPDTNALLLCGLFALIFHVYRRKQKIS